ncbi:MAG: cytochrome c biogenesis protein CcsA [Porticoccus sp.]
METESFFLWAGLVTYVIAGSLAIVALIFNKRPERVILTLLLVGLVLHGYSIGLRWDRLGHGPFTDMYEILSSNIWSLLMVFAIAYWRIPLIRPVAVIVLPVMYIMMAWILMVPHQDTLLPPTYNTIWLYVHIGFGKIFLGSLLMALGLAICVLLREMGTAQQLLQRLPNNGSLDELAYRFVMLALVFDSLMLIAGGIWAQDAWGRYWAWDPLETWSFVTWVLLALVVHVRLTFKLSYWTNALIVVVVFIISFMTFFGIPFISTLPHKGVV